MLEYLINDEMVCEADRIAVGVSGGADSMVLLWALIDKQKQIPFYFEVVNVNHHLRGEEGDGDSKFVEEFCKKRKIDYKVVDVDVLKLKKDEKMSVEEAARAARFDAFKKVMKSDKLNKLFLAHHKNDQAETILMHILRGSGVSGAAGIKNSNNTFRPLLNLKKSEILKIAKDHGVTYVEDSTNADSAYSRNYLRNVVLPQIEKVYPSAVDAICAFGEKCADIQDFVISQINEDLIVEKDDAVLVKEAAFDENKMLVREYIKKAFDSLGVFADVEAKHYALCAELVEAEVNKELSLPHETIARRVYEGIKFFKKKETYQNTNEYEFLKDGEISFGNEYVIKTQIVKSDEVEYSDGVLYLDAAKVSTNAVWRTRRLGDKFSKFGTGSKKLNDYFTNQKIEVEFRDRIPLLATGEQVLVVIGDDISENVKIDADTDEIVKITFEKN